MFAAFQLQLSFAFLSCQGGLDLSTHFAEDKEEEAEKEETAEDEDAKESGLLTPPFLGSPHFIHPPQE